MDDQIMEIFILPLCPTCSVAYPDFCLMAILDSLPRGKAMQPDTHLI
jgi:hypothetical protein